MIVVANWKAFFTPSQALSFFSMHKERFACLVDRGACIVVCPSYTALHGVGQLIKDSGVSLGAQNCSVLGQGPFTGFVSVQDIQDSGCTYSLVGHSEQRMHASETNIDVGHKAALLYTMKIKPIVCVGESKEERAQGLVRQTLELQLTAIINSLNTKSGMLYVAYEPVWAIGTGEVPSSMQISEVFDWLYDCVQLLAPELEISFLYGGSISAKNAPELIQIKKISGFLVGKASLDFQEFEKIVDCTL